MKNAKVTDLQKALSAQAAIWAETDNAYYGAIASNWRLRACEVVAQVSSMHSDKKALADTLCKWANGIFSAYDVLVTKQARLTGKKYFLAAMNKALADCDGLGFRVFCYSAGHKQPALFSPIAPPEKAPAQKTASGKSDAPTGDSAPDSSNKKADTLEAIELPNPYTVAAMQAAIRGGALSLSDLKKVAALCEAENAEKAVKKATKAANTAIDSQLAEQFKRLGLA